MKVTNANDPGERAHGIVRGHTGHRRAGSSGITVRDGDTSGFGIQDITVIGGSWTIGPDGTAVLVIDGAPGTGTPPWFNVVSFGAIGDGTTDDTSAINDAIDALNAEGCGVLYFPCGTYLVTAGLTTITATAWIMGDGHGYADSYGGGGSEIRCSSGTANLLTVTGVGSRISNIGLRNTAASPSAGCGFRIGVSGTAADLVRMDNIAVVDFYDCISVEEGGAWKMSGCWIVGAVRYGIRIRYISSPDGGDQAISDSWFYANDRNATSAIRVESGGGLKITNTKINEFVSGHRWGHGIDVAPAGTTSILLVSNSSIENVSGDGIHIATSGSDWDFIGIMGVQFGLYTNSTGNAIEVTCANVGEVDGLFIDDCFFHQGGGGSAAAINLTKVNHVRIGSGNVRTGFASMLATSGCTNLVDATGGVAEGVAITGVPSSGYLPIATSATAAPWTAASALADTHSHTSATLPAASASGYLLLSDDHSGPIVFGDILQADDYADFLYSEA